MESRFSFKKFMIVCILAIVKSRSFPKKKKHCPAPNEFQSFSRLNLNQNPIIEYNILMHQFFTLSQNSIYNDETFSYLSFICDLANNFQAHLNACFYLVPVIADLNQKCSASRFGIVAIHEKHG